MYCKSVTLCDVSPTAQCECSTWCVVCSVSGCNLTLLFCYKIVSDRRDEIYVYKKMFVLFVSQLITLNRLQSWKQYCVQCAWSNSERACQILPSAALHLTQCILCCCKAELNLIYPYKFRFQLLKSVFFFRCKNQRLIMLLEIICVFLFWESFETHTESEQDALPLYWTKSL